MICMVKRSKFEGIFITEDKIATVNLLPGEQVYGEVLFKENGLEYREWDFWRSKPAAAIKKGLIKFPLKKGMSVLYLGAANGTTVSHFSDIVGNEGLIYSVEISERPFRELMPMAEKRGNIVPILGNARIPEDYENIVLGKVDFVYEDVASDDQIQIMIRNCEKFLSKDGFAAIAIKSQSIDVTKPPRQVYNESIEVLSKHFEILDKVELDPYEKFHLFVMMRPK